MREHERGKGVKKIRRGNGGTVAIVAARNYIL
jgi:hypothetical protein